MMSLSFWAHVASLVAFCGAGYWALRLHRQRQTLAELMGYPARVRVDWPIHFLIHMGPCLGIKVDVAGSERAGDPVRVDLGKVSEFFRRNQVSSISAKVRDDIINIDIVAVQSAGPAEAQLLQQAFQGRIAVTIKEKR